MSAFKKPLPLKIFSVENEPRDIYVRCFYESMESSYMKLRLKEPTIPFDFGSDISIEFIVSHFKYQFDSALLSDVHDGFIFVRKPKVIYKKAI